MILFLIINFLNVPLENTGELFYGYYPTKDTTFNSDVSMCIRTDLLEIKQKLRFFVRYSSYLEMAQQKGGVILDPAFADYSFIAGFQYDRKIYYSFYLDHYCRHLIDRDLNEGKAVFNALNFVISNIETYENRFGKDYFYRFSYIFYPQGIIIDWLNPKPYYRHRFLLSAGKKLGGFMQMDINSEYTLSNDEPKKVYYSVQPGIQFIKNGEESTLYLFIKYNLFSDLPFRSSENLFFIGLGYAFY